VHELEGYGDEARTELRGALQLLEGADERRFHRIQKHISVILAAPLKNGFAMYVPKSRFCIVDYKRMKDDLRNGERMDDMLAKLIVSCSVNALLESKRLLNSADDGRVRLLGDKEALRFSAGVEAYHNRTSELGTN
jgi:hypothetical protein